MQPTMGQARHGHNLLQYRSDYFMKVYTYEIVDNGYFISVDGVKIISQLDNLAKIIVPDGTYEDNAKAQIAEMQANGQTQQTVEDEFKKVRADVDFLLLNSGAEVLA